LTHTVYYTTTPVSCVHTHFLRDPI